MGDNISLFLISIYYNRNISRTYSRLGVKHMHHRTTHVKRSKLRGIQVIQIGYTRQSAKYKYNITDAAALSTMHKLERFASATTPYTSLCSLSEPHQGPDLIDLFKVVQTNEDLH